MPREKKSETRSEKAVSEVQELIKGIWGWNNIQEVANEVYGSIHNSLLNGKLIFAVKTKDITRLVISQRLDDPSLYRIGLAFQGYTANIPKANLDYLRTVVYNDLVINKASKEILQDFTNIINKLQQ